MDFVKCRTMQFPRLVFVGHGVLHNVTDVVRENSVNKNIVIITGKTTYDLAGKDVEGYLSDAGMETFVIKTMDATAENFDSIISEIKGIKPGLVMGVGGGSKIDLAKKAAFVLGVSAISVPTTPSHDGIASPRATIKRDHVVLSEDAAMPMAIIADTSVMIKAPYRFLAAGAADVIANITAVMDWKLSERLNGEEISSSAAALSEYASRELIEKADLIVPNSEEAVWLVTKQILASGTAMAVASSSRPASGSEHLFAHALEKYGSGSSIHGEQVAMGSLVSIYLHGGDYSMLKETYKKIGLPTSASSYGISEDTAVKALMTAHSIRPERFTILGVKDMSEPAARKALEITGII